MAHITAQSAPSATTLTTLYTVTAQKSSVVSALHVCNRSATATTFRVAIRPGGASISNEHYLYYDVPIGSLDAFSVREGWLLNAGDVVSIYAGAATLSFTLWAQET